MFTVSTPCFLSFWDFRTSFFIEEAWFWGVRVGFGGREGALASALITVSQRLILRIFFSLRIMIFSTSPTRFFTLIKMR